MVYYSRMANKEATEKPVQESYGEVVGMVLFFLAVLLLLALFSFDKHDLAFNGTQVNAARHNLVGVVGAWVAQIAFLAVGASAYLLPPLLLLFALAAFFEKLEAMRRRWPWAVVLVLSCTAALSLHHGPFDELARRLGATDPGGFIGTLLNRYIFINVGTVGASIILICLYGVSLLFLTHFRLVEWLGERWTAWRAPQDAAAAPLTADEAALSERAQALAQQYRELQKEFEKANQTPGNIVGNSTTIAPAANPADPVGPSLGADLKPVPEPTVRDLSMPVSKKPATDGPTRQLAAIMFTDIAGYTRLSNRDEKAAMKLIKQQRKLLRPIVEEFEGEWLKEIGDGLLLSFPSSLNAVNCAVRIQEAARAVPHLNLRIGVHQGDIVREGGDIYGDGVNIASRIEKYAPVGGIAVSEKIQQDISSHPEINLELLGEFELEGVDQRVEVFTVTSNLKDPLDETKLVEPSAPAVPVEAVAKGPATMEEILGIVPVKPKVKAKSKPLAVAATPLIGNYQLPPRELLKVPEPSKIPSETKEEMMANSRLMQQTLAQFGIEVAMGDITKGPTITRYELHPAPGVKLEKIVALSNNIAAALRAERINILAPVPGKSSVGVEVANRSKCMVSMRDLLESDEWSKTKARIPVVIGKDVYGNAIISDLAEMPHLLIAGATGAGKSVCINTIIASLLYRFSPDQLRLVMIDPKVVELQMYNTLPHLVVPVVTDPKKVILALRWVVLEMEKRYKIFAKVAVKNIAGFNTRSRDKVVLAVEQELPLYADKEKGDANSSGFAVEVDEEIVVPREEEIQIPDQLSYVVVVIDELADLMLSAPADVEMAIARITQMARAAGIHCIVATQRPSVDVITGVIKANIPARIAFQVASKVDSRTIIDKMGAEKLLGKGDMLYMQPSAAQPMRAQGALVTDQEIQAIVDFIAKQGKPSYEMDIHQQLSKPENEFGAGSSGEDEELINKCIEVIRSEQKASVSLLQRRLRLGYTRAARIMDDLQERGIVGPNKGAEPRDILIDLDVAANLPARH